MSSVPETKTPKLTIQLSAFRKEELKEPFVTLLYTLFEFHFCWKHYDSETQNVVYVYSCINYDAKESTCVCGGCNAVDYCFDKCADAH